MNYYGEISALLGIEMNKEYLAKDKETGNMMMFAITEEGLKINVRGWELSPAWLHKLLKGEAEIVEKY